jgi:hypothetical protein
MDDLPNNSIRSVKGAPRLFVGLIFVIFAWIVVGICFIYGVRLWFNSPVSPSFMPLIAGAFCAALSFTLVLALEYVTGPIKLKLGWVDFEGASGPIVLWCLCFFVIAFGLYLLGVPDTVRLQGPSDSRPLHDLFSRGDEYRLQRNAPAAGQSPATERPAAR